MNKWNQKWLFHVLIPQPGCSQASGPHLPPTRPSSPRGQAAGTSALLSAAPFPLSRTLLKERIVWAEGRTRVAHYKSELLSDKWAMKSVLTSLRCSWTRSLLSLTPMQPREDRVACRVTRAWLRSHQIGSFWPHGVFLHSASWKYRHFIEIARLASLQTFLEAELSSTI